MELPQPSSSTATNVISSTTSNCTTLCEKLLKIRWRRLHVENTAERGIQTKFGGFTTSKLGPPQELREDQIWLWNKTMLETWKWCVNNILIANLRSREEETERKMVEELRKIDNREKYDSFITDISRGIKFASRKYLDKYNHKRQIIPEPPRIENKSRLDENTQYCKIHNFIKRGELWTELANGFVRNRKVKERENVFILLAQGIYNSTRLHRIIVRNFWTYINRYEKIEIKKFRPFMGKLTNGQEKNISTWNMLKKCIQNRVLEVTNFELEIIATLYCIQIRVMKDITVYTNPYLVRERYECIWNTHKRADRVVNLLRQEDGKWAILEGVEYCRVNTEIGNKARLESDHERSSNKQEIAEEFNQNTYSNISQTENEDNYIQDRGKGEWAKEIDRNIIEINERKFKDYDNLESIEITESNNALSHEKRRIGEEINIEEETICIRSKRIDDIVRLGSDIDQTKIGSNHIKDGKIEERVEEIEQSKTDTSIVKFKDCDTVEEESTKTTDSINALFYEESKIAEEENPYNIGERKDESRGDLESLYQSRISTTTINTLPSIDSIENSILYLDKNIRNIKLGNTYRQASKTALKNTLWQRCRTIERDRRRNEIKKRERNDIKEGKKIRNNQLVFDFTSKGLDTPEIELLSKGEGFSIANNKVDEDRLKVDLYNYTRRLRLHDELVDKKEVNQTIENSQFSRITQTQDNSRRSNSVISTTEKETPILRSKEVRSRITQTQNSDRRSNSVISTTERTTPVERSRVGRHNSVDSNKMLKQDKTNNTLNKEDSRKCTFSNLTQNSVTKKDIPKARRLQSTYDPNNDNRNLTRYSTCIQEEGILVTKQKIAFQDNIHKDLRIALKKLKDRVVEKEIIITKADKGSGLVALDYELYIDKGTHYIEIESQAYKKTEENQKDIVNKIVKERNKIVSKLKKINIISDQTATYCTHQTEEKITGVKFYYKVHKSIDIKKMPLRPLQSCIMGPTHHLSQVLTDILQPLLTVENIPTFIQDSNQLLVRLSKLPRLEENDTIITSDVAALYPSIPHKEGLEAMSSFLSVFSKYSDTQIGIIINALKLVITKNYVKWNGNIYEQIKGVAMGTPVAVAYANIFMHWIDTELNKNVTYIKEHIRYIDDNLFIIPQEKIEELMQIANAILSPSIKYTYEALDKTGEIGLPFLDTQLFISDTLEIESRLYTKKTDKHAYLLPSSYHPTHITKNIPLSTFFRLRRICSKEEWFKADAMLAIEWLEDRDYKYRDIIKAIGKAIDKDRWELINSIEENRGKSRTQKNEDNQTQTIPIIVTYSQNTLKLKEILKQRQDILDASFSNTKVTPRVSFRRQNNIGDILVQKSLRGPITGDEEISCKFVECGIPQKYRINCPCKGNHNQKKCRCCAHACFEVKDITVKIYKKVTCESKNLVYLISCRICKKKYVGETQQKLRERLVQHLNNIPKLNQPLYTHFNSVHKPIELSITVLETMRSEEPFMRKIREAWWINKLQTLEPKGFNVKLECNQMYLEDRKKKENEANSWK